MNIKNIKIRILKISAEMKRDDCLILKEINHVFTIDEWRDAGKLKHNPKF